MTASAVQRRRSAYAAAAAAKQRRRKVFAIVGFAIFLAVMAYQVPRTLELLGDDTASTTALTLQAAPEVPRRQIPKEFRAAAASDPFESRSLADADPQIGSSPGGHDPFAPPAAEAAATPAAAVSAPKPLPQTIVIGKPTATGSSVRGWIVILASIPTRQGQGSALSFARSARRNGVSPVAVLNSSNRRPLRGGYWVVYTGPVRTLGAAERIASGIHSSGYRTAYLRELIEYR